MEMTKKDWRNVAIVVVILGLLLACAFAYINEQAKKPEWLNFLKPQQAAEKLFFFGRDFVRSDC
ncbi:MAG: hypothetical protein PHW31_03520 [Candidatus Pacebacteria bacterium]|nr:hypothetical protein [Candidatus Paceibacterota bacterium]